MPTGPMVDGAPPADPLDPFDLPEWLGVEAVTWQAQDAVRGGHLVRGRLTHDGEAPVDCDLLAVDEAHPRPVAAEETRRAAHLAWRHGQVHVVVREGRMALACPGAWFTADGTLDAVERLARAVGAEPSRWAVLLSLGGDR